MEFTPVALHLAPLLHASYLAAPNYFALLGNHTPTLPEVEADVATAIQDPRRHLELLHDDAGQLVGSLDYKSDYPQPGDVTINLLLIHHDRQNQSLGAQAIQQFEARLPRGTCRILASVLGDNPRGVRFWERLGYTFELDARPAMTWYAKRLRPAAPGEQDQVARLAQP
ncbi:GNAT family N-acetyltransferase [Deinococcus sp.]|uniref:GNAT family N-acetyltransferase n=1 Tax=Deinococcus sp. TaxID=47478 RepID=UPI0025BEAB7A|nr:GNAT family N-acetyltransferase [Deinococcus sp.]